MTVLMSSTALLLTIFLTMVLGIAAGYAAVMGLLYAFGHRTQVARPAAATFAPSMGSGTAGD